MIGSIKPSLVVSQIQDQYVRQNFQALQDYFNTQNQLQDFKFFEQVFTAAQTGITLAHGLSYIPLDVIVTRISGVGAVTFQYGKFDSANIVMDVSGPCRIRFFAGTYLQQSTNATTSGTDAQKFTAGA